MNQQANQVSQVQENETPEAMMKQANDPTVELSKLKKHANKVNQK